MDCKSTQQSNVNRNICFFPTVRWCAKLVFLVHVILFLQSVSSFPTARPTRWSNALSAACSAIDAKLASVIICSRSSPKMRTTTCKTQRRRSTLSGVLGMSLVSRHTFSGVVWMLWGSDIHLLDGKRYTTPSTHPSVLLLQLGFIGICITILFDYLLANQ